MEGVSTLPTPNGVSGRERLTFVAVVRLSDLALVLSGKISPVTTQASGPQVEAKKKI